MMTYNKDLQFNEIEAIALIPQDFLNTIADAQGVSKAELEVLSLSIEGKPTSAIAQKLGISEDLVRKRLSDVYQKFEIPGRGPVKLAKLQQLLHSRYQDHLQSDAPLGASPRIDLQAPETEKFYGRTEELKKLEQLIEDGYRLVVLRGPAGIGKTALSVKLAKIIQDKFEFVIWRSLYQAPKLKDILTEILNFLSPLQRTYQKDEVSEIIQRVIEQLRAHKCLLILDNIETILSSGELVGYYNEGYENYQELFRIICSENHKSCLVITTQETPDDFELLVGKNLPITSFELPRLSTKAAGEILNDKKLVDKEYWEKLVDIYRGNPLALKMVSTTIVDFFNGKVSEFIKRSTLVPRDIRHLLSQQFERLSLLEKEIAYWLAIERQPLSLDRLLECIKPQVSSQELIDAMESLLRRSFIEKTLQGEQVRFTLPPAIIEYISEQIIEEVRQEIVDYIRFNDVEKLRNIQGFNLFLLNANKSIDELSDNPILQGVKTKLYRGFKNPNILRVKLKNLSEHLSTHPGGFGYYTAKNIDCLVKEFNPI